MEIILNFLSNPFVVIGILGLCVLGFLALALRKAFNLNTFFKKNCIVHHIEHFWDKMKHEISKIEGSIYIQMTKMTALYGDVHTDNLILFIQPSVDNRIEKIWHNLRQSNMLRGRKDFLEYYDEVVYPLLQTGKEELYKAIRNGSEERGYKSIEKDIDRWGYVFLNELEDKMRNKYLKLK